MTQEKEVSGSQAISYRNYRRARDRALTRLSHLYADEYKRLLVEEREVDEQEGKKWIGVSSSNRITITTQLRETASPTGDKDNNYRSSGANNDGGKA